MAMPGLEADEAGAAPPPPALLLQGPLAKVVSVPTNTVPAGFLPPASMGMASQLPAPTRGARLPESSLQRSASGREGSDELTWLPPFQPELMPYLAAQDEYGNTAIQPGPLIPSTPVVVGVQQAKYWVSQYGLRYSLQQTTTWVSMTDVAQGANTLGFYTFDFAGKWAIFGAPAAGTAGWVSAQIEAKTGLGEAGRTESAQSNLGTATNPTGIWSRHNGIRVPELAWQQSFADGQWVVLAGMVSQGNYLDVNSYANSGRGQFLNSALINSMVLPLPDYNLGVNIQWQPSPEWYAMLGNSVGNGVAGQLPWLGFSWDNWSLVGEVGYAPTNVFNLGPGVYRMQPFVAQIEGEPVQVGFGLNFQQQLGPDERLGWFGRFGYGGSERRHGGEVLSGTGSQISTGFVVRDPLESLGLGTARSHDAAGIGFVWSRPSTSSAPVVHDNEYVLEAGYVLQLTPTLKLQPDLQAVWNPVYNAESSMGLVFQLQLEAAW